MRIVPIFGDEFKEPHPPTKNPSNLDLGAYRGSDVAFVFQTPRSDGGTDDVGTGGAVEPDPAYWADFARTGKSQGPQLARWPRYQLHQPEMISLVSMGVRPLQSFAAEHHCAFSEPLLSPPK